MVRTLIKGTVGFSEGSVYDTFICSTSGKDGGHKFRDAEGPGARTAYVATTFPFSDSLSTCIRYPAFSGVKHNLVLVNLLFAHRFPSYISCRRHPQFLKVKSRTRCLFACIDLLTLTRQTTSSVKSSCKVGVLFASPMKSCYLT
jgi:hypothetical protein